MFGGGREDEPSDWHGQAMTLRPGEVEDDLSALATFVDHLRKQGCRTYVGEVPLPSGKCLPVNLSFERDAKKPRRDNEE